MRSLLFVPGDSPRKLARAMQAQADALLIDLEDSVALAAKIEARGHTRDVLAQAVKTAPRPRLFVRVNALETGLTDADLDAVMPAAPDGILLPKARSGTDIQHLAAKLAVREAENGLPDGATRILALVTETARSLFHMGSYTGASHRLDALAWGMEDLSADLGASRTRLPDGTLTGPCALARSLLIIAAASAGVAAIDTVYPQFSDHDGLQMEAEAARKDGFTGKLAIHPGQVPVINAVFTPSPDEIARAHAIIQAFTAHPGAGVVALNGRMLDKPHLAWAQRMLARAGAAKTR